MISKRLTKSQKEEIIDFFRKGKTPNKLAEKYKCTSSTIIRTVKNFISEEEYISIKEKRLKEKDFKSKSTSKDFLNYKEENTESEFIQNKMLLNKKDEIKGMKSVLESSDNTESSDFVQIKFLETDNSENNEDYVTKEKENIDSEIDKQYKNSFEEIAPLPSSFGFETKQRKTVFQNLSDEILPETVYMLVDKKVELESQVISDLPEWSFLPENELKRHAIVLYNNQRSAKRNCARNQRVIKIPNTSVFNISKSYLLSKGISRLIIDDLLIAL